MSPASLPKPPAIDGYEYREAIGSGGSSYVYLYYEQTPFRRVAVKMPRIWGPDPDRRALFVDEANMMAQFEHEKTIVPVLAFKEAVDGTPCLVTAYYEQGDLYRRVKKLRRLPVAEVLTIGGQLAEAVAAAHAIGLLHQDIKPANVFIVTVGGGYRLGDFGIARRLRHHQDTFALSPSWAAPEVMNDENATERSDIYSLGATLWHLLSGSAPFVIPHGDNSPESLKQRTLAGQPAPGMARQDVPAQLTGLLLRMLARNPQDRPRSADAVLSELTRIAALAAAADAREARESGGIEETVYRDRQRSGAATDSMPSAPPRLPEPDASAEAEADADDNRTVLRKPSGPASPAGALFPSTAPNVSMPVYQQAQYVAAESMTVGARTVHKDRTADTVVEERQAPAAADAARRRGRGLFVSLGAVAAVVIAVVVATLSTGGAANGRAPGASGVSASVSTGDTPINPGVPLGGDEPPGPVTVTATRTNSATLRFGWTYSAALATDTFRWQTPDGKRTGVAKTPALDLPDPAGTRLCVQIKVVRVDGSNGDPDWSQPGCGQ